MTIAVGEVAATLRYLLNEVRNVATAAEIELPERQYITTGGAVYDCAQVTVSANRITVGIAGAADQGVIGMHGVVPGWAVDLELAIVRDASEAMQGRRGTIAPAVTDIEKDTEVADNDAAILCGAVAAIAGPEWDQRGAVPASIQFGDVEGNLTAVVLSVSLNLWSIPFPADQGEIPQP